MSELTALAWPVVVLILALPLTLRLRRKAVSNWVDRLDKLESDFAKERSMSGAPAAALDVANRALSASRQAARDVETLTKSVDALNLRSAQDNAGIESALSRIQKLEMARMTRMG